MAETMAESRASNREEILVDEETGVMSSGFAGASNRTVSFDITETLVSAGAGGRKERMMNAVASATTNTSPGEAAGFGDSGGGGVGSANGGNNNNDTVQQYRIHPKTRNDSSGFSTLWGCCCYWWRKSHAGEQELDIFWLNTYLHWTFRASFLKVILASVGLFMILITVFALFIICVDRYQPECIVGVERGEDGKGHLPVVGAWHLSWTTLSTAGYGVVAAGLPSSTVSHSKCIGINILMAFESFVGVLFGGIMGAIIFAKVARVQSFASVVFSDPIVVRYGTGCCTQQAKNNNNPSNEGTATDESSELPCPVLEFRMINTSWNQTGGEIMDASVNLVVSRLETPDDIDRKLAKIKRRKDKEKVPKRSTSFRKSANSSRKIATTDSTAAAAKSLDSSIKATIPLAQDSAPVATLSGRRVSLTSRDPLQRPSTGTLIQRVNQSIISSAAYPAMQGMPHVAESEGDQQPYNRNKQQQQQQQRELQEQLVQQAVQKERTSLLLASQAGCVAGVSPTLFPVDNTVTVDEGADDDKLAPRRIFLKLEVETDSHPFFHHTWLIRHVCNETSPLLPRRIRRRIAENNGFWPADLNHAEAVRRVINFHEIIVSFSGTANASGRFVYAQKVYEYIDMTVGYTFANVLAKDKDGKLIVDEHLLNDVKEQRGGGAEPIGCKDDPNYVGYAAPPSLPVNNWLARSRGRTIGTYG